ncbi:L,D-transpeptidase family protein [Desulfobulbus propionicus]|jgi:murein L,D-transpeptidase YafK
MNSFRIFSVFSKGLLAAALLAWAWSVPAATADDLPTTPKAESLMAKIRPKLQQDLQAKGFTVGQPIFVRIFKIPGTLEVWMNKGRGYQLFKTYNICTYSGFPGPKLNEGDWQAPEGFYNVAAEQLNPNSGYHLAFDVGYPNEFDVAKHRTGGLIMVHGNCKSVGCFAMTNGRIEEIYFLAHEALAQGQEQFSVHIFPFPLTQRNLRKFSASPWISFWKSLEPGYAAFEQLKQVPEIAVHNGEYVVASRGPKLAMRHSLFGQD